MKLWFVFISYDRIYEFISIEYEFLWDVDFRFFIIFNFKFKVDGYEIFFIWLLCELIIIWFEILGI